MLLKPQWRIWTTSTLRTKSLRSLLHSSCSKTRRPKLRDGPGLKEFIAADSMPQTARDGAGDAPYLREKDIAGQGRKGTLRDRVTNNQILVSTWTAHCHLE